MKFTDRIGLIAGACLAVASVALANCSGSNAVTPAQSLANAPVGAGAAARSPLVRWRLSMQHMGLPAAGCFTAKYPATHWSRVACAKPPNLLYPLPRHAIRHAHATVGDGNDYTVQTGTHLISQAVGSFPAVSGVTKVKSTPNPAFGLGCSCGPNAYTLQLNSSFFSSAACNGQTNCAAWEQFVYENPRGFTRRGELFIQDWLVPLNGPITCPSGKGWTSAAGGCVQNSPFGVLIPNQNITALSSMVETGQADSTGDSVFLAIGNTQYGLKDIQSDGITDLSTNWTGAEFNVVGNAGGSIAIFNSGSTITVNLQADDGVLTAPTCQGNSGTTGESSNLRFVAAPAGSAQTYPSIEFKEAKPITGLGSASCDAIAAI